MTEKITEPAAAGPAAALPTEAAPPPAASTAPPAAVAASSTPAPASTGGLSSFLVDLLLTAAIALLVSAAVVMYLPKWLGAGAEKASVHDSIVTLNFEAIVRDQISALSEKVRVGDIEPRDMPKRSEQFMSALLAKIKAQTDEGKIVLRSEQVLGAPDTIPDLTDRFRSELQQEGAMERKLEKGAESSEAGKDSR
ncbi:TrbI F-type domain-containing protein [Paracidovorax citrulli]|uniref:TrbI F-type domain-containing protein n=1 Tax=Paracidovorax citrulli TaxID=80869 RepID=UPI003FA74C7B